jgi:hypothetical protein
MIRLLYLTIVYAAFTAASEFPVLAQDWPQDEYRGTPEQQAACTPDVLKVCGPKIPDVTRIMLCLRYNIKKLSPRLRGGLC